MDIIQNAIDGRKIASSSQRTAPVYNPATGEQTAEVKLSTAGEVSAAVAAAKTALQAGRTRRRSSGSSLMFRFKELLQKNVEAIAAVISKEHGKTHADALGEVARGIDVVDFACGIPHLFKGEFSRNVGAEIDSWSDRQPLGVVAGITPFNFPAMVPMWMYPVAIACGNTFVLKPSERDPSASMLICELFKEAGFPPACSTSFTATRKRSMRMLDHPDVKAVSFVGSTPVAEYVYCAWLGLRQTRAGAGRRQEPHDRHARRRHGPGRRCADGRGLRLGRRALHGDLGRGAGRREDGGRAGRGARARDPHDEDRPGHRPSVRDGAR